MTTKIKSGVIGDNVVGITQLNVSDGTNGQVLTTDGSGTLSFSTISSYTDSDVETYLDGGTSTPTFSTITSEGTVTINPSSGDGVLNIQNGGDTQTLRIDQNSIRTTTNSDINLFTNGNSNQLFLKQSTGNVGIGTNDPATKLDIVDANGIGLRFGDIAATPSSQTAGYIGMSTSAYSGVNGDLVLIPRTSTSSRILLMEGNVGIGITSPSGELHVDSGLAHCDIHFTTGSTGGTGYDVNLNLTGGANNSEMVINLGIDGDADREQIKSYQGNLYTRVNNNQRAEINSAGKHTWWGTHQGDSVGHFLFTNQGFDSTSTNCTLAVQNGGTFIQIMGWTTAGARIGTRTGGWNSNSGGDVYLTRNDAVSIKLASSGPQLGNGTAISSDERLKENITNISDGQLAKINALTPRNFTWKDPRKTGTHEGFIAQEVEAVIPEAVFEDNFAPDPDDDSRDFEGDIKLIRHEVINARLIKAVQELSAELEAAKERITTLENA
jgi:hypothetical protein